MAADQHLSQQELKDIVFKNSVMSVASQVFYLFTRLFIAPLALTYVTMEEWGIWSL